MVPGGWVVVGVESNKTINFNKTINYFYGKSIQMEIINNIILETRAYS